jgi:hypothetical protein
MCKYNLWFFFIWFLLLLWMRLRSLPGFSMVK